MFAKITSVLLFGMTIYTNLIFAAKETLMTLEAKHVSTSVAIAPDKVYDYIANPENLPHWASGLSDTIKKEKGEWIAESALGKVKVAFAEKNKFGVADHDVTMPNGVVVHNPLRVLPNGEGSEVVFTLFRRKDMTEKQFAADEATVRADLQKLKGLLEAQSK